jgi:hypothetical protein
VFFPSQVRQTRLLAEKDAEKLEKKKSEGRRGRRGVVRL